MTPAQPTPFSNVANPTDIAQKRKLAMALMQSGADTSPVGHWTQALARAVQGGVGGYQSQQASQQEKSRQDAIAQALAGSGTFGGLSESDRAIMANSPEVMQSVATKAIGNKFDTSAGKTESIKEYEYAVKNGGFKGSLQDWMVSRRSTQGEYNKNPIFGTRIGPDGKPQTVMLQAGSRGDAAETRLPEGVSVNAQKPIEVDAGTHTVLLDPITRTPIAQIPKNVGETARQREVGKDMGAAQVNLPTVESNAQQLIGYIDSVAKDPNLDRMLDYRGLLPNVTTTSRTLQAKINQLNDSAFLMAFERLKGGGAITETEGAKATQAMSRLKEMMQSGQDYRAALQDFRNEVSRLTEVARRKAGAGGPNNNAGFEGQGSGGWSIKRLD